MFLVDPALVASDWDGITGLIQGILKRAGVEIVCLRKWAERKLAYEIQHKSRGTYIQCYFRAEGRKIAEIERDIRLSERIMRTLILLAEDRPAEVIERDMATLPPEMQEALQPGPQVESIAPEVTEEVEEQELEPIAEEPQEDDGSQQDS
jgi:small subunit ribosomal protein S6